MATENKFLKRGIYVLMILCLAVMCFTPFQQKAAAAEVSKQDKQLQAMIDMYQETTKQVSLDKKNELVNLVKENIANGNVETHFGSDVSLDFNKAEVVLINDKLHMVKLSVNGGDLLKVSGMSVFLDENNKIINVYETHFKQINEQSGSVKAWSDGKLLLDKTVKESTSWSYSKFNDCLAGMGVPAWTVTALMTLCGAACIGTSGLACAPCYYGAGAITGGAIGWCLGQAA
ncbi:hypothetical protein [Bacillus toyonensis]|uniref:hypothetical protein n=1 Tax=Bacillus toyonensis TaxID=155322 RepID=UPI001C0C8620|nr:hypothetical protein [Bacillus toyonensis]MBU4642500.1 hypothetical protein [Bacillus toyonensis]